MIRHSISKLTLLGIAFSLFGCSSSDPASGGGGGCIANSTNACIGPNGCQGVQTCSAQGSYSPCSCSSGTGGNPGTGGTPGTGGAPGYGGQPSGGTGGAPASCNLTFADSTCNGCFQSKCQSQCADCSSNPDCIGLNACVTGCTTSSCISSCLSAYPGGATDFESALSCATGETLCGPVCDTNGPIAASCNHDYQCTSGDCSSSTGFCTMLCTNSNACGDYAWCMPNSAGYSNCFPACQYNSDCDYLGSAFTCQTWTSEDGYYVSACAT